MLFKSGAASPPRVYFSFELVVRPKLISLGRGDVFECESLKQSSCKIFKYPKFQTGNSDDE